MIILRETLGWHEAWHWETKTNRFQRIQNVSARRKVQHQYNHPSWWNRWNSCLAHTESKEDKGQLCLYLTYEYYLWDKTYLSYVWNSAPIHSHLFQMRWQAFLVRTSLKMTIVFSRDSRWMFQHGHDVSEKYF
jgi:hypothetical protein